MDAALNFLRRCWLPAVWSKDLADKPVGFEALGTHLVALRGAGGTPVVMEDRCAHRGVALSDGYVVDGSIMCRYHGWRYDADGRCLKVPSLLPEDRLPDACVPVFRSREQEDTVWFTLSETPYTDEPPHWRHLSAMASLNVVEIEGYYTHLMENLVDNPHAGYIHAGLIRGEPTQRVTAEIQQTAEHIVIRTTGEKTGSSLLFKLLGKKGEAVGHTEEYLAPNQMVSTYSQLGRLAGVQSFVVPIDEHRTRWFFRPFLSFGPLTSLVFPLYNRIVLTILMQDAEVVRQVHDQACRWPGRRILSTKSDVPSLLVASAARAFAQHGPQSGVAERTRTVEYML